MSQWKIVGTSVGNRLRAAAFVMCSISAALIGCGPVDRDAGEAPAFGDNRPEQAEPAVLPAGGSELIDQDWLGRVTAGIRNEELRFTLQDGEWHGVSRTTQLRAHFNTAGVSIAPRDAAGDEANRGDGAALTEASNTSLRDWRMTVRATEARRGSDRVALEESEPREGRCEPTGMKGALPGCMRELEFSRSGGIREWWRNTPQGFEQGFTVSERPAGTGDLRISVDFATELTAKLAGNEVLFYDANVPILRYSSLIAHDARGRQLPARFEWRSKSAPSVGGAAILVIDDAGARYPIEIDPLLTLVKTLEINALAEHFGSSVAAARINCNFACSGTADKYADIIVGTPTYDNGQTDEGRIWVFHATTSGFSDTANYTREGDSPGANFGFAVAGVGDTNADGYEDVLVGSPFYTNGGRVSLYFGGASGLAANPNFTRDGGQAGARCGETVSGAGDVDNNGKSDFMWACPWYDNPTSAEGIVNVTYGNIDGLLVISQLEVNQNVQLGKTGIAAAGDVNGDGYPDVVAGGAYYSNGQTFEGRVYVFPGSASGVSPTPAWSSAELNQASAFLGYSVAGTDVNGDGYGDIIATALQWESSASHDGEGKVIVYHGKFGWPDAAGNTVIEGNCVGCRLGERLVTGNFNGDAFGDVAMGMPLMEDGPETSEGVVRVHLGSAQGLRTTHAASADSDQSNAYLGRAMASGDVNNDGASDLIIGAPDYDNPTTDEGRVFVYHGKRWIGLGSGTHAGAAIASCNMNNDGISDIVIGDRDYNGSDGRIFVFKGTINGPEETAYWSPAGAAGEAFGASLACGLFFDGFSLSNLVVGSPFYTNGQTKEGRVRVYAGATGTPSLLWTEEGDIANAQFGFSVGMGTFNNDFGSDVIVGAPYYSNGQTEEGAVFVYYANSTLPTVPSWQWESGSAGARAGWAVASAGSVDGDNFSDLLVGAPYFSGGQAGEGRIYLFDGSGTLPPSQTWVDDSNVVGANLGYSLAGGGDFDSLQSFKDIVVGAPGWDSGEGRALVYYGSATGLPANPSWHYDANDASDSVGFSVAIPGDVDHDGFSDIVVGIPFGCAPAPNCLSLQGKAVVFLGDSTGFAIPATPQWVGYGKAAGDQFGSSVAGGDFNGDTYADVIVGAPYYEKSVVDEGAVFMFSGTPLGVK